MSIMCKVHKMIKLALLVKKLIKLSKVQTEFVLRKLFRFVSTCLF